MTIFPDDYFGKDRNRKLSELSGKEPTSKVIPQKLRVNKELIADLELAKSEKEIDIIAQKFTSLHFESIEKETCKIIEYQRRSNSKFLSNQP